MSLEILEKYFLPFIDPLERFHRLSLEKILSDGLIFDISSCLIKPENSSINDLPEQLILINKNENGTCVLSLNFNIYNLPFFYKIPNCWFDQNYRERFLLNKKTSLRLQMRIAYKNLLLFSDEKYTISFISGNKNLDGYFNQEIQYPPEYKTKEIYSTYETNLMYDEVCKIIQKNGLQLKITLNTTGQLRELYTKYCEMEKTIQECFQVTIDTIKESHYYLNHFEFYNNSFKEFNICEKSSNDQDFFYKILKLNIQNFSHLDFFQWLEFLMGFSMIYEHKGYCDNYRNNVIENINNLKTNKYLTKIN